MCLISRYVLRLAAFVALAGVALVLLSFGADIIGNFSDVLQCLAGYFLGCLNGVLRGPVSQRTRQ